MSVLRFYQRKMSALKNDKVLTIQGFPIQMLLIITWGLRDYLFYNLSHPPVIASIISIAGMLMFVWCLNELYIRSRLESELITTGLFKYSRHPMYTGVLMMDLRTWFIGEFSSTFILSAVVLYSTIIAAAYIQEKETIARFGEKAVKYYDKTPRLILMYPFYR